MSGDARQAAHMTRTIEMVESRPVRMRHGCGHHGRKAADLADNMLASASNVGARHRAERTVGGNVCVPPGL